MRPAKCAPDRSESSVWHNRKKTRGSDFFFEDEVQKMCTAVVRARFDFHKEFALKNFNLVLLAGLISCLSSSETAPIGFLLPIVSSYFLHYFSPGAFRPGAFRPGMPGNMFYLYITFPVYRTIQSIQSIQAIEPIYCNLSNLSNLSTNLSNLSNLSTELIYLSNLIFLYI